MITLFPYLSKRIPKNSVINAPINKLCQLNLELRIFYCISNKSFI